MLTKTLITFNDAFTANLIKGKLESAGIECVIWNENFSSLMPQFSGMLGGGIRLMVNEQDYDRAYRIVHESDTRFDGEKVVCPSCNSKDVKFSYGGKIMSYFLIFLMLLFRAGNFNSVKRKYTCNDCGMRF